MQWLLLRKNFGCFGEKPHIVEEDKWLKNNRDNLNEEKNKPKGIEEDRKILVKLSRGDIWNTIVGAKEGLTESGLKILYFQILSIAFAPVKAWNNFKNLENESCKVVNSLFKIINS